MSRPPIETPRCKDCGAAGPLITTGRCIACTYAEEMARKQLAALRGVRT